MTVSENHLELIGVTQAYGDKVVLKGVSFGLPKGAIGCLVGQSGCGKTTALRTIAGFEPLISGEIYLNGVCISSWKRAVAPEKRGIGLLFQDYALLPHLGVASNVGFGLHRWSRGERERRVDELLEIVGLQNRRRDLPSTLSGGEQQRVALARALAPKPELLLMDEPFSNLDMALREELVAQVREILRAQQMTAIIVTHNHNEALEISDEMGILEGGRLLQWAPPYEIYHSPADRFVADFIGEGVFLPGKLLVGGEIEIELGRVGTWRGYAGGHGGRVEVLLRPDDIVHDDESDLRASLVQKVFRGGYYLCTLRLGSGQRVFSLIPSHHDHAIGETIGIRLDLHHLVVFPSN